MPHQGQSFNDTLRTWGVGGGAYLVLPLFGPSDYRGLAALPVNSMASASSQISDQGAANALTLIGVVDRRASLLDATKLVDDVALDKYHFIREAYLQRRKQREGGRHTESSDGEAAVEAERPQ